MWRNEFMTCGIQVPVTLGEVDDITVTELRSKQAAQEEIQVL